MKRLLQIFRDNDLHAWVFTTGAIILIIEVVAVRILSPYFGNTLFSISSVLSVVLLALSVGYYVGGNMSDKHPSRQRFYAIIAGSGVLVLIVELLRTSVLEYTSQNFSFEYGPLISAIILFIAPAFLLGTLSPLAIKIRSVENKKLGIGAVTGGMFFWSTLGSISGSLSAGFVLIPRFGIDSIMLGIGIFLILLGGVPLILRGALEKSKAVALFILVGVVALSIVGGRSVQDDNILYEKDGLYEKITIAQSTFNGRDTRFLVQDTSNSGASYTDSDELVFEYTKYFSVYEAFGTTLEDTLLIGGGAYSISTAMLNEPDKPHVDVVEIEPDLYELSKKYFGVEDSPRLDNYIEDGRRFLVDKEDASYDLIYSDVYKSLFSIPSHFTTVEFFDLAKSRLSDDGVFVANIIGDTYRVSDSFVLSQIKTFRTVFPNSRFYATRSAGSSSLQNIIMVGAQGETLQPIDYKAFSDNPNPILAGLEDQEIDINRFTLDEQIVFTDDYAPVDFLISKVLSTSRGEAPGTGQQALDIIEQLVAYGPRHSGADGNDSASNFISAEARTHADETIQQKWSENGVDYTNVIARFAPGLKDRIILGSHYDSKQLADRDPRDASLPVPGANDSSSGVATLLSVARILSTTNEQWPYDFGIDFVFFDGEEGPPEPADAWRPIGSEYFADNIDDIYPKKQLPRSAVILDMVCEKDSVFLREPSSQSDAPRIVDKYWDAGSRVAPNHFVNEFSSVIRDDHTSLNAAGIPSALVIDLDYEDFHTTRDTPDNCSVNSLESIIATTLEFISSN